MLDFDYVGKYKILDGRTTYYGSLYDKDPRVRERMLFPVTTAEELVTHMKKHGVDKFISFPADWATSDIVQDQSYHIFNTQIAEAQKKYPDNIIGFGRVQPNYKGKAEEEARRCFEELGLKGLHIHPEVDCAMISNQRRYEPIMELLAEYDYPLLAHCDSSSGSDTPGRFYALAENFPDVKIIMSGGGFTLNYDAMVTTKHNDNVYLGMKEMNMTRIKMAVEWGLIDRLIYESFAPYWMPNLIIMKLAYHPKLTEEEKAKILGGNLAKVLRIKL